MHRQTHQKIPQRCRVEHASVEDHNRNTHVLIAEFESLALGGQFIQSLQSRGALTVPVEQDILQLCPAVTPDAPTRNHALIKKPGSVRP